MAVNDAVLHASKAPHGLITLAELTAAGRSRSSWFRAHKSGLLVAIHPGVSRLASMELTPSVLIHAAVLAAGVGGIASHRTAAFLWGADVAGVDPVDITVTTRTRGLRLIGVRLHRPTDLGDLRPVPRDRTAATNPLRTALDVGAVCTPEETAAIIENFVIRRYLTIGTLRSGLRRHSRRGRAGLGVLRTVLDDWALTDKPPDSTLEPAMARLLEQHRLPPAAFHHVARTAGGRFELDFAFVDARVAIEVDGWAHHGTRAAFEADRARDSYLAGAGWVVLRFTWYQVTRRASWVATRIAATLAARQ
jgi:very-short-patch-repair endonuclease